MSDETIAPALTPEEWASRTAKRPEPRQPRDEHIRMCAHVSAITLTESYSDETGEEFDCNDLGVNVPGIPALIALANAALPDSDPRKITRAWADDLRTAAYQAREWARECPESEWAPTHALADRFELMAAVLASYLPPE